MLRKLLKAISQCQLKSSIQQITLMGWDLRKTGIIPKLKEYGLDHIDVVVLQSDSDQNCTIF